MRTNYAKFYSHPKHYINSVECMKNEVDMLFVASGLLLQNLVKKQKRRRLGSLGDSNGASISLKPADVLDVCCGPGNFSNYVSLINPKIKITGIDTNESFIKYANKRFSKLGWKFLRKDATNFKLNKKFDFILAGSAYHHMSDNKKVNFLAQLRRHLKEDGRVMVCENFLPRYSGNLHRALSVNKYYKELRLFYSKQKSAEAGNCIHEVRKEELGGEEHKVHFKKFTDDVEKAGLKIETDVVVWQPKAFKQDDAGSHVMVLCK